MTTPTRYVCIVASLLCVGLTHADTSSRSLIGNWSGNFDGQNIEIAVWFDRKPTELPLVRGYMLNNSKNCGAGLFGVRSSSVATTFFGRVSDPALTDYSLEVEVSNLNPASVELCSPLGKISRLMIDHRTESGDVRVLAVGDPAQTNNMTNMQVLFPLQRQTASASMRALIASNPQVGREQGPGNPPGASVSRMINDATLNPESVITSDELPCVVQQRDQQVRMLRKGIRSVAASLDSAELLGVRYEQYAGPVPNAAWSDEFRASKEDRYVQVAVSSIAKSDFLEMPAGKQQRFGPDACSQATAVSQFLTSLEAGAASQSTMASDASGKSPRLETTEGLYFFDAAGIDRIQGNSMRRVFGTTTIFVPGDISREGRWTATTQSMRMRAMVKTTQTDFVEPDLLSFYNEAKFAYDAKLSERYGGDIWITVSDARDGNVCLRWRDKHFNTNCTERSTAAMYQEHRYYMTRDLAVAKAIFAEISPNAITLSAEELADPMRGCDDGLFCDLPGGTYINAILEGDFDTVQMLNELLAKNARAGQKRLFPGGENAAFDIEGAMLEIAIPKSPTANLAHRYMYQYQKAPTACLEPGHDVVKREEFVPASYYPQPDIDGIPQPDMKTSDAYWLRTSYTINPAFFALCDRLCTAIGDNPFSAAARDDYDRLGESIDRVLFDNDCKSAKIKKFETNLIDLAFKNLSQPPRPRFAERSSL